MIARVHIPVVTSNELNANRGLSRNAMHANARKRKATRETVTLLLAAHQWPADFRKPSAEYPYQVVFTRVTKYAPRMDDDGLASSLKSVRDAVAKHLGVDDKHRHIVRYSYDQAKGTEPGVLITFIARQQELA